MGSQRGCPSHESCPRHPSTRRRASHCTLAGHTGYEGPTGIVREGRARAGRARLSCGEFSHRLTQNNFSLKGAAATTIALSSNHLLSLHRRARGRAPGCPARRRSQPEQTAATHASWLVCCACFQKIQPALAALAALALPSGPKGQFFVLTHLLHLPEHSVLHTQSRGGCVTVAVPSTSPTSKLRSSTMKLDNDAGQ
jgi:hypothetical protein